MTSKEAYLEFQILMNKNASLRNINIPPEIYVLLYNRESKIHYRKLVKESTDDVHELSELLVNDEPLSKIGMTQEYVLYNKPINFFNFVSSRSITQRGDCESVTVNYLYKPKDLELKYSDSFYVNFDHEESIVGINDYIQIFKKGYDIKQSFLSYYREIPEIDIVGYFHLDGRPSENKDPNISDHLVHLINNWVVLEVMREFENGNGINVSKERIMSSL